MNPLERSIRKTVSCEIHTEREYISFYSADASAYRITPRVIIIPDTVNDIKKVVCFARKKGVPVTPRGAGTGLVGSALNEGIILDMKKFDRITVSSDTVTAEAGISKGLFDKVLKDNDRFFAPNPSIGPYCSIGGMIGNNASGSRSLKYGSMIDNIKEITFVDGNARLVRLPSDRIYAKKILEISKTIQRERFPGTSKNSCGYRLDAINTISDTPKIIAASEGTLGIVISAKLKTRKAPSNRKLFVMGYDSVDAAAKECANILIAKPSALEFIDKKTLGNIEYRFPGRTECLLFVEFDSRIKAGENALKRLAMGKVVKVITGEKQMQKWWRYRDSALHYSLKSVKKERIIPHIIEDAAVPLDVLPRLFSAIKRINEIFKTESICYGHAGSGNIHVRLISGKTDPQKIQEIAAKYFEQIIRLGGTITGEHGDGLARTPFVRRQYGDRNYQVFRRTKALFDPRNILNPNKITGSKDARKP